MISYYPPHLSPFLSLKSTRLSPNLSRLYYLSWEDALWDILPQLGIKPGDTILVPDFYCLDVINNIKLHGYRVSLYPLDNNFQISKTMFMEHYRKDKPSVVIFFHACGITNNLTKDEEFIKKFASTSIVIEDQVHHAVDPSNVRVLHNNHLVMSSLRKNMPLPGSFVYLTHHSRSHLLPPRAKSPIYVMRVTYYYLLYRLELGLGVALHLPQLVKHAHHTTLSIHDDLVGDSIRGNVGLPLVQTVHGHISFSKIRATKKRQVQYYLKNLLPLTRSKLNLTIPSISNDDLGELHAFPLIANLNLANKIEESLMPLNVWTKFPGCPWSKKKQVFFLPLGFHITIKDQTKIIDTIIASYQTT